MIGATEKYFFPDTRKSFVYRLQSLFIAGYLTDWKIPQTSTIYKLFIVCNKGQN